MVNGATAPPESTSPTEHSESKDDTIKKLEEELYKLKLDGGSTTPVTEQKASPSLNLTQDRSSSGHWGQQQIHQQDLEKLVRDHVATNQQFVQTQSSVQGSYTGPRMADIRRDPNVQSQADLIMNQIKSSCPVFGQTSVHSPALPGINPLGLELGPSTQVSSQAKPTQQLLQHQQHPLQQQQPQQQHQSQPGLDQLLSLLQNMQQNPSAGIPLNGFSGLQTQSLPQHWPQLQPRQVQPSPQDLLSALPQLHPTVATTILQALQQPHQVQPHVWNPQPPQQIVPQGYGLYAQQLQNLQSFPQQPIITPNLGLPNPQNPPQFQLPQPVQRPASNPQQQQGMSSMTGVSFLRPSDFVKYCQVDYAKKVKPDNCNLVLYVWGYVAQLLASKQGLISSMSEQEQIGRLQHLLHVLELCAMQSPPTDFNTPAWLCAKNYSERVYQDLDTGATTWSHIGPKMHPTNMMQAMATHPKKTLYDKPSQLPSKPSDPATAQVCPKWSSCEVEDKCLWEVENPGRSCNRPHFCSFCHKKYKQIRKHKDSDCRKKAEQAVSGSDQPTS